MRKLFASIVGELRSIPAVPIGLINSFELVVASEGDATIRLAKIACENMMDFVNSSKRRGFTDLVEKIDPILSKASYQTARFLRK